MRILRLARFAARFDDFHVAPETLALCQRMVADGEADALVPERVWREIARGLMQASPSRTVSVLADSGALARVAPAWDPPGDMGKRLDEAARRGLPLAARYALACLDVADAADLHARLKVPTECADAARLLPVLREGLDAREPDAVLTVIERCDGLRKPERFAVLLRAAGVCAAVDEAAWLRWLDVARGVDAGAAARTASGPADIRQAVRAARLAALTADIGRDYSQ